MLHLHRKLPLPYLWIRSHVWYIHSQELCRHHHPYHPKANKEIQKIATTLLTPPTKDLSSSPTWNPLIWLHSCLKSLVLLPNWIMSNSLFIYLPRDTYLQMVVTRTLSQLQIQHFTQKMVPLVLHKQQG